ncbi:hypothetical protein JTB14_022439 [Gonioctena quinquepunctata]|nr:hypothetical protein JTB14_022439 [Gonioctena quinquepunctata]
MELTLEENMVEAQELQAEESNVELPIAENLEEKSEYITEKMLNCENNMNYSDSEDENTPKVTHMYPTRSEGPIEYFSMNKIRETRKSEK